MDSRIETLISLLENRACDCDMLYGWQCDIHKSVDDLRDLIKKMTDE